MKIEELRGKKIVILALGKYPQGSGVGAARFCLRHGAQLLITDTSTREKTLETVEIVERAYDEYRKSGLKVYKPKFVLGGHRKEDIAWCDIVVQGPDVRFDSEFVRYAEEIGKSIETDLTLFFHFCPFSAVGITGTRGKTTTTMLTGEIMKLHDKRAVLGGNLRVSPLEALDKILKTKRAMPIVLEISSWQAEGLSRSKFSPHITAITNLSEDHLNRYGTMEKYSAAKESLFAAQTSADIAIFNHDDARARAMGMRAKGRVMWTAMKKSFLGDGAYWQSGKLFMRVDGVEEIVLAKSDVKLEGEHNLANVLTAVVIAKVYGVSNAVIKKAVRAFKGVPHRQEIVRVWKGITFVNDTTATSPDGLRAALDRFHGKKIILLAGGTDKALTLAPFAPELAKKSKFTVLFGGTATDKLIAAWPGKAKPPIAESMKQAFEIALVEAKRGDVVLLSPGAASFGIFKNEFDRGEQFVRLVKKLK